MIAALARPRLHHSNAPGVPDCLIAGAGGDSGLLLAIVGTRDVTGAEAEAICATLAAQPAFARMAVVVPLPGSASPDADHSDGAGPALHSAAAGVLGLLAELDRDFAPVAGPISLLGFGKGARTAQEVAMRDPCRVARLCLVSAGWYAMPIADLPWPYGTSPEPGVARPAFLDIPTTVVVGLRDTRIGPDVPQDPAIQAHQGRNRLRRARCYVRAVAASAEAHGFDHRPSLVTCHGISADFQLSVRDGGLMEIVAEALF